MLARLVLLILVIIAVSVVWRRLRAMRRRAPPPRTVDARAVRCAHCQVYLPSQDAVLRDGEVFCSAEHAARGRRAS
ncbi:MAG: PP0621 family protein [Gammaproteobacteria bacterium]